MKIELDTEAKTLKVDNGGVVGDYPLYSDAAFEIISKWWLKVGWHQKYSYTFTWMGRPIIQHPEDMFRLQEVIHRVRPDVILECGIAHGGSLIFHASMCKAMEHGRVIGVDIEIRQHNRAAIESHPLFPLITMVEGSSIAPDVVQHVKSLVRPGERVLLILDSNHTKAHVLGELEAYSDLVGPDSYIVAADGEMMDWTDTPRGKPEWATDNPVAAVEEFVSVHPEFEVVQPEWEFNESTLTKNITCWPKGYLRRRR
jgi:cephalosporin hydroxylase